MSLNFNIKDSSSEELEVDMLDFKKLKTLKMRPESETQEISHKVLRNRYFSSSPDTQSYLRQEKSPRNITTGNSSSKQGNQSKISFTSKGGKDNFKASEPEKKIKKSKNKTKEMKLKLEQFKLKHQNIITSDGTSKISKKLQVRREYISDLRNKHFSAMFVKKAIFNAWKGACRKII